MDRKFEPVVFEDFDDIPMDDLDEILNSPTKPVAEPVEKTESEAAAEPAEKNEAEAEPAEKTAAEAEAKEDRTPKPVGVFAKLQEEREREAEKAAQQEQKEKEREAEKAAQVRKEEKTQEKPSGKTGRGAGKGWKKALIIIACVIVAAAIGAYGYGVYYYTGHFLPTTKADGVRIDNLTAEEAQQKLADSKTEEDSVLILHTKEGDAVPMSTEAMGIRRNYLGLSEALAAQEKWLYPVNRKEVKKLDLQYEVICDKDAAMTELNRLDICDPEKTQAPVNSYVAKNGKKVWKVVPPVDGNTIDKEALADVIGRAVMNRQSEVDLVEAGVYKKAEIREDDPQLIRRAELENRIDALNLSVDLGANTVVKITPDEFRGLLREEAWSAEPPEQLIDEKKFDDFMLKLASRYNTKSASGWRTFRSVSGETIVLESNYGWDMDIEATGSRLKILLEDAAGKVFADENADQTFRDGRIEAVWNQTAVSHGERDTGNTFVEVNITKQKMYCVVKGSVVLESNIVSGMEMNSGRKTPGGIYTIKFKQMDRDLVGYNPDGTEAYRSHVTYWMPFNKNIGLHDASWRGHFGGNTYLWSGSHGCINLPVNAARKLYSLVEKGTPVIVYRENKKTEGKTG